MQTRAETVQLPDGVRMVRHAADLPRAAWDALAGPADFWLTCRWLDVVEATAGVPMAYLWTERAGTPVACLATATATAAVPWALGRPDVLLRLAAQSHLPGAAEFLAVLPGDPTEQLMPTLLAGGRHTGSTRMLCGPDATPADITALAAAAEELGRQAQAATVCYLYLDEHDRTLADVLTRRGYRHFTTGEYCSLQVPTDGFDGYLAALPRKRRQAVTADRRRIQAAGVTVTAEALDQSDLDRFAELESGLLAKYGIDLRPPQLLPLLRQLRDGFGDDAFAMVARADGAVRGFALILRHNDTWYARQTGYDYAYQQRTGAPLYFELLYYRLIEQAAAAGVRAVHYGLGSADTKRSRGCTSTEQRCHLLFLSGRHEGSPA